MSLKVDIFKTKEPKGCQVQPSAHDPLSPPLSLGTLKIRPSNGERIWAGAEVGYSRERGADPKSKGAISGSPSYVLAPSPGHLLPFPFLALHAKLLFLIFSLQKGPLLALTVIGLDTLKEKKK